ncbi:MAG: hypothetical protein ASUL_03339 [Candidatus Aramenus sulfurataquae]|jgi:hypothetical protein|uniref:Uncharacterized protein n=3 Tax=Candidatus Aramenus sulfurataquae TaxID=1326980 RepID=W7KJG9_9CREN|nr:MAG: hypothetical protein ASUL_03339 [Candidatus Aramenus sulfurataquae]MCL7343710.1 hypothetical protein [Candidatus Aramenus sulfurataquae]
MKPLLLGIDALSYTSFMKCNPRFLLALFSSTFRGVVLNKKPQHPASSWMSVLEMQEVKGDSFFKDVETPTLIKETKAVAINIPITNPTYGEVSFEYNDSVSPQEEISKVAETILEELESRPVIASITVLDRMLHKSKENKCELYKQVDDVIRKIVNKADDFILFSPYGEPTSDRPDEHEDYGVYLSTVPRPNEHDTVKLHEIGVLFRRLVGQ